MKTLKLVLLIAVTVALCACGSSKSNDGFEEANLGSTTPDATADDAVAVCSKDMNALSDFEVHAQQYVDQYGQARKDIIRLQIKKAPSAWQTNNLDLSVFRWTASPTGSVILDSTPLNYMFEKRVAGGFQLLSNIAYRLFNWTEIVQMGTYANITATSPQTFFNVASLVVDLKDTTNSYQALQVVLYNGSTAAYKVDLLIPTFQADPARYNADPRHPVVLRNLHPLKALVGQSWSQANYDQFIRANCF